jgi:trehalose-phosphatase
MLTTVNRLIYGGWSSPDALRHMTGDPQHSLVCVDYDGTASDYNPDPAATSVATPMHEALAYAARVFHTVALLTGRSAEDAHRRVPEAGVVVGLHSAEWLAGDTPGRDEAFFERAGELAAFTDAWREEVVQAGLRIQQQGPSVTLHYGSLRGGKRTAAFASAQEVARDASGQGFRVHQLSSCIEIRPGDTDKGIGIGRVLELAGPDIRHLLYVGDDWGSDEAAFLRIRRLCGTRLGAGMGHRLISGCCGAVVHLERRAENRRLWHSADITVEGTRGVRGLIARLAAEADPRV